MDKNKKDQNKQGQNKQGQNKPNRDGTKTPGETRRDKDSGNQERNRD